MRYQCPKCKAPMQMQENGFYLECSDCGDGPSLPWELSVYQYDKDPDQERARRLFQWQNDNKGEALSLTQKMADDMTRRPTMDDIGLALGRLIPDFKWKRVVGKTLDDKM